MRPLLALPALLLALPAAALQVERLGGVRTAAGGVTGGVEVVSGEALVRFDPGTTTPQRQAAMTAVGARFIGNLPSTDWSHVALPAGLGVSAGMEAVRAASGVREVAPNHAYRPHLAPTDTNFFTQYHLDRINAPQGWDDEVGSTNRVTIAVLDAGVEGSHSELSGKLIGTSQFCDPGPNKGLAGDNVACAAEPTGAPVAACNHGTRVAGTALAETNNNRLVAGVSWGARLISLRTFRQGDCDAACTLNSCATDDTATISAIDYARTVLAAAPGTYGKVVVNASIGGAASSCDNAGDALSQAVTNAVAAGVVFVAAAGNDGAGVNAPGNCADAIPVGATDSKDRLASFSSRGAELNANGVVAPGVSIITTDIGNAVTPPNSAANGTSFAAPIVSGLAALLLSRNNTLTPAQVKTHIRNGAETIGEAANNQGAGRVNVCRSIKSLLGQAMTQCISGSSGIAGFKASEAVVAFPNPLRTTDVSGVTIKIPSDLQGTNPKVRIYTMDGVLVKTVTPAANAAVWDGRNESGNPVASGVYLVAVGSGSGLRRTKLAVIR